jgi:hypothetical protein
VALLTEARSGRPEGVREGLQLDRHTARPHVDLGSDTIDGNRPGGVDDHLAGVLKLSYR